jgi:hypothetical protein
LVLAGLDQLLARKKNKDALIAALEEELRKDPVRFFRTVIMPLLPRESKLSVDNDGIIRWKSLLGDESGEKPRPEADGNPLPDAGMA